MEAATYLGSGFGIRTAMESRRGGWLRLGSMAHVSMPGRLKAILVSPGAGTPFLAATQVFDLRPTPRKWVALERTTEAASRFVKSGAILVTRSGSVGRAIVACAPHEHTIISDDLLRVEPIRSVHRGWVYACLRARQVRAMAIGAQYGHVIKHLEVPHLTALPVPTVDDITAQVFATKLDRIVELRNSSYNLRDEADALFAEALGPIEPAAKDSGFVIESSALFTGRRRFEASFYAPTAFAILRSMKRFDRVGDVTERVWWITRFKRFFGIGGISYLSADELFTVNPPENKRILIERGKSPSEYFVRAGWIVMARSGQVYGMNGAAALMTEHHESLFLSDDLIRIIPDNKKMRAGYLLVALTHPTHGRPLLIRAAYGTSIPHLDPDDVADFHVARLDGAVEDRIADLAEDAAKCWADADALEREIEREATAIIDAFLSGPVQYELNVPARIVAE